MAQMQRAERRKKAFAAAYVASGYDAMGAGLMVGLHSKQYIYTTLLHDPVVLARIEEIEAERQKRLDGLKRRIEDQAMEAVGYMSQQRDRLLKRVTATVKDKDGNEIPAPAEPWAEQLLNQVLRQMVDKVIPAPVQQHEVGGVGGGPIQIVMQALNPEVYGHGAGAPK